MSYDGNTKSIVGIGPIGESILNKMAANKEIVKVKYPDGSFGFMSRNRYEDDLADGVEMEVCND